MKKSTFLTAFMLAAFTSGAHPSLVSEEAEPHNSLQTLGIAAKCLNTPLKLAAHLSEKPMYEEPEGDKIYYERTVYGYYYDWDTFTFGKREGGISIIYAEDGKAYIHNPISGWATNSYLQGELTEEGIEVTLPQLIMEDPDFNNPGQTILFYAAVMKCVDSTGDYVTYEVVEENVTFLIDEEGNISFNLSQNEETPDSERILGLCDDRGNLYFGDAAQYLNKVNLNAVTPPEGLQCEDWMFYADGNNHGVQMGFDGNDVYLQNFDYIYAPGTWIKGKIEGDYITFDSGQFLAEDEGFFYWFVSAGYDGNTYSIEPSMAFYFDREKNMLTTEENQNMVSSPFVNSISYAYPQFMSYPDPVLKLTSMGATSNVPQNPHFVAYLDQTNVSGMYFCEFDIYPTSIDYDPIDPSQLSFRVYVNDAAIDNFTTNPVTIDFPYGFWGEDPNYITIFQLGTNVVMYLYFDGCDSIGMQLVNSTPEGEEFESALVVYHVESDTVTIDETADIATISPEDIVSSECYNINGIRCNPNSRGLHIIIDHHSDGSVTSRKIMVK